MNPRNKTRQLAILPLAAALCLGFSAAGAADVNVTLGWTAPDVLEGEPALTGYCVHYGTQSRELAPYDRMVDAELETQVTVSNLVKGQIYYFAVTASNETGAVSEYSEEISWSHGDLDTDGMQDAWEDAVFSEGAALITGDGDEDQDGMSNAEEFVAGTDPLDAASKSEINIEFTPDGRPRVVYTIPAVTGTGYEGFTRRVTLELLISPSFGWLPLQQDLSSNLNDKIGEYIPTYQPTAYPATLYRVVSTLEPAP